MGLCSSAVLLSLLEIQIEGKSRMPVTPFIQGYPKIIGEYFE